MTEFARPSTLTLRASTHGTPRHRSLDARGSAREMRTQQSPHSASTSTSAGPSEQRVLRSDSLLQGRTHVLITHNGETYQLRATRLGKLILTK
ncbi:hemin uptake protein HemP [Trinickia symbiotica]|uniref:Hemin uptake protein HemP n=1 Tax=Trinickia symbiotica TaxID=863227 RepID=A0A2N7WV09_9BURK|nr:hemin uptake protein HemP [Trinickia symbiotica]PMS33303.1 hemin uptake protein HemP [Trinickia symbiotica]PPK42330.1 hemin uptake protein HemP [Trinickia symbiotica]